MSDFTCSFHINGFSNQSFEYKILDPCHVSTYMYIDRYRSQLFYRHSFQPNHHLKSIRKHESGFYVLSFQPTETLAGETKDDMVRYR